jgi:hypothetical protein
MFELKEIAVIFSGIAIQEARHEGVRFMRLADLSDLKAGRNPALVRGKAPEVARAVPIESGDLIVAARGAVTDVCTASEGIFGAYISLDLYLVRPQSKRINSEYLRTVIELSTTQAALASEKQGSGLARLPKEALEKTPIPVPPLHRQQLIAGLAVSFEDEQKLLNKLGELKACFAREVLGRAIGSTEGNFPKRST